jgi:hypothetical protein
MSIEDNQEQENSFDITDLFMCKKCLIYDESYPSGRDYLYFYSLLEKKYYKYYKDVPFAFWTEGMTIPSLFKLSPNKVNKYDRANILKVIDLGEEDVAADLVPESLDLADRMDRERDKITAMTPLTLNKSVVDIYGIEFNIEYMPEYIILPSGSSMRDNYSDEILARYFNDYQDSFRQ